MSCFIYKISSPSGKIYIGQTVNVQNRLTKYKNLFCKGQTKLFSSIKKYGWEKHKFEIIHECPIDTSDYWEIFYIKKFKTFDSKNGLNLTSGGKKGTMSEQGKEKLRKYFTGRKRSPETIEKMKKSLKGRKPWNKGIPMTEEGKENLRLKNLGKKHSEETRKKQSIKTKGRSKNGRRVFQYNLSLNFIQEFCSIRNASKTLNIGERNISQALTKDSKTAGGFKWRYKLIKNI